MILINNVCNSAIYVSYYVTHRKGEKKTIITRVVQQNNKTKNPFLFYYLGTTMVFGRRIKVLSTLY